MFLIYKGEIEVVQMWQKFRRLLRSLTKQLVTEANLEKSSWASRCTTKLNCKSSAKQAKES